MVYYRKYRPQTIEELDSQTIRQSLTAVLAKKEPPHAFLFTGPKGLGKTSTARIVAKTINCERIGQLSEVGPCNECQQCLSITNGSNIDIIEMDGASNRNIDDVRDLKEKVRLSPAAARKKVYIIDEVHMFTSESFNALLKTLEEPPAHAMFILCTTEKHKVPATIVSRCFNIDFSPATEAELVRSFKRIAEGEGLKVAEESLLEIAKLAEKGFRDGAKILEELAAFATDKKITKELVEERYKLQSSQEKISQMTDYLQKRDTKAALDLVQKLVAEKIDLLFFISKLMEKLHMNLLHKTGIPQESLTTPVEMDVSELRALLLSLREAYQETKQAILPQLPLELAIIDWSHASTKEEVSVGETSVKVERKLTNQKAPVTVASMRKQVGDLTRVKALYGEPKPQASTQESSDEVSSPSVTLLQVSNNEITPEWLAHFWQTFIQEVKQHNHTIAGVLRGCRLSNFDNKEMIIETSYKFHKERLDDTKTRQQLESISKTLTGNPIQVEIRLKG